MAHIVPIEDSDGEVVDVVVYCSDYCASSDANYRGWYGCQEIATNELCKDCGAMVEGIE